MASPVTLYRFRIDVSDVDRGFYESLDLRVGMHPSEIMPFLLTRVLAFALNAQDGLEFAPGGLSDTEEPCIRAPDPRGGLKLWIEVGNPSARKLHKAAKASREVKVYTYKNPELLLREMEAERVHRAAEIEVYSFSPELLRELEARLKRDNSWGLVHAEGSLTVTAGEEALPGEVRAHSRARA